MKKIFMKIIPIIIIAVIIVGNVYGITAEIGTGNPDANSANSSTSVKGLASGVWNTVAVVVQTLAIAAIVIAGVRYMFASANDKADIKKQTIILVVGAVLVFAAVPVASFISTAASQIIK